MEKVLVMNVSDLSQYVCPDSVVVSPVENDKITQAVQSRGFFVPRRKAENNPIFKQIIPYIYIIYEDNIFLTNRKSTQAEARLHNKFSIGVGGHINEFDIKNVDNIIYAGMLRELNEEVLIDRKNITSIVPMYILSDDTTEVGKVHLGIVYKAILKSLDCSVHETDKMEGRWVKITDVKNYYNCMETWSQIILDYILLSALHET